MVDPALAAASPESARPFELAAGEPLLASLRAAPDWGQAWCLMDVDQQRKQRGSYDPPRGLAVSAIFSYLPPVLRFVDYESRKDLLARLGRIARPGGPPTVLVLHGEPGIGKSTIALGLGADVDFGCGWVLNASNPSTLRASLARAHRAEYSSVAGALDAASTIALAAAALTRLNDSQAPWVVILDNCDSSPDTPGFLPLVPAPREPGQLLIITTTHPGWLRHAEQQDWARESVPKLSSRDLKILGLPERFGAVAEGLPLVAQILGALGAADVYDGTPSPGGGGRLAWDLFMQAGAHPDAVRLARMLAWCPSDPVDLQTVSDMAGLARGRAAADQLADAELISFTEAVESPPIQMHRLIAQVIREQNWDDPASAVQVSKNLVLATAGQTLLAKASDGSALARLENEADRVQQQLPHEDRGLFAWGLAKARGDRGPQNAAAPLLRTAVRLLNPAERPRESAESLIGLARVVYQEATSRIDDLQSVQGNLRKADYLLAGHEEPDARQLRAQGNALAILIDRRILRYAPDQDWRLDRLLGLLERTWDSYEERVRIAKGLPDDADVERERPKQEWGESADRAYFNLAGFYIALAQLRANNAGQTRGYLEQADAIYVHCRQLREERYSGIAHPFLAACIHGSALVAYYQATLLGDRNRIIDAISTAQAGLMMRSNLASAFAGSDRDAVLRDPDVRKSTELLLKASTAATRLAQPRTGGSAEWVEELVHVALTELGNLE